jgi:bifunctional enzyme CysN/CysC
MTLWLTGLSGSGKSTVAHELAHRLTETGVLSYVLDADNLRHGLNGDLGFSDDERRENVRRVGEVAALMADVGVVTIVPIISPFAEGRNAVRSLHVERGLPFFEVFVATSLEECELRDPKGLYRKVREGQMSGLSGVDAPYEPPTAPDSTVGASGESLEHSVEKLMNVVRKATGR